MKVAQSCPTLCYPMDSPVHGVLQARIMEWVAFPFSRGSSHPGTEPRSPSLQADSLPDEPQGKPKNTRVGSLSLLQGIFPPRDRTQVSHIVGGFFTSHKGYTSVSSVTQSCPTLCEPMDCSRPGFPVHPQSQSLLKLMYIEAVTPSNHLILCHPLSSHLQFFPASGSFQMSQFFS